MLLKLKTNSGNIAVIGTFKDVTQADWKKLIRTFPFAWFEV